MIALCLASVMRRPQFASNGSSVTTGRISTKADRIVPLEVLYQNCSNSSTEAGLSGSVGCASDWRPGCRFDPRQGWQHSFVEIVHEIFSTVILSLSLIQEGQSSVTGERMRTTLVNRLED